MHHYIIGLIGGVLGTRLWFMIEKNHRLEHKYECPVEDCGFMIRSNRIRIIDLNAAEHAQWHLNNAVPPYNRLEG